MEMSYNISPIWQWILENLTGRDLINVSEVKLIEVIRNTFMVRMVVWNKIVSNKIQEQVFFFMTIWFHNHLKVNIKKDWIL